MDKFNFEITQAYMVIRGDNLFTILVLPSFFDLDPFFSKRRVRGLIYVYKRGRFAFWGKHRLRQLAMVNQTFPVKNYWIVKPTFSLGYFGKYKGILKEAYDELKRKKMEDARKKLLEPDGKVTDREAERTKLILKMREEGDTMTKIGRCLGVSRARISQIIAKVKCKE